MSEPTEEIMFAGKVPVTILKFRRDKHDFCKGWETEYLSELIATLKEGMTVFDIGAENGEFGAMAAKIVGGNNMHLFEPSPEYWANIRRIWIENKFDAPSSCFDGYVGRYTDFNIYDYNFGWNEASNGELFYDTHQCTPIIDKNKTISLDDYCAFTGNYPNIIMMDIEGAELDVLNGAKNVIEKSEPIIFISIHSNELLKERSNGTKEDLFKLLNSYGYNHKHINTDHEEHWKFYKV